jgi:hypothetical protein
MRTRSHFPPIQFVNDAHFVVHRNIWCRRGRRMHCGPRPDKDGRRPTCGSFRSAGTRIVPAPLCCASWRWPTSATSLACRLPRSIVSCAPAGSPNANSCSTRPPPTKSTKPSSPIRSGSPTCSSAPGSRGPGGGKQQVFLQAALDDASRLIPHAQFYPNQGLDAFLDCLRQAIAARGRSCTPWRKRLPSSVSSSNSSRLLLKSSAA